MSDNDFEKRYLSAMECVASLRKELDEKNTVIAVLEAQRRQWEVEKIAQQVIIAQALTTSNATNHSYLEENARLQAEIAQLKKG